MLRSIFGFDWEKSPAHLLFLSKFRKPRAMGDFSQSDTWRAVLKEAPKKAMRRFLDDDLLEQASLSGLLDYKYKVSELKPMLKQRGLPVSGRKAELIERLIQADSESMRKAVRGLSVLQCTEKGRAIAEEYLAQEKEKRIKVEEQTLQALRQCRFREASQAVAAFEAQQVFPRGIGIDWKHYNPAHDVAMLEVIFQASPKILSSLNDEQMKHLRLAAGMMHLWGTNRAESWLPNGFETGLIMDNDAAARMILFYASHQRSIAQYRAAGVRKVEILATDNSCTACKKLAKKKYKIDEVPELPYEKCTSEMGCRCTTVVADF
jgi:hypothetical protein